MSRSEQVVWHSGRPVALHADALHPAPVLLVSELFPPAVGGSGVLLRNVYARFGGIPVEVLTHASSDGEVSDGSMRVLRRRIAARDWGIRHPAAMAHHLLLAARIRGMSRRATPVVHCARVLPEGLAAWIASAFGGPRYVCWTHGEELAYARASRELTWLMRVVHRRAAAVVANSRNTACLLQELGVDADRICIVHPGVDSDRFRPTADDGSLRAQLARDGEVVVLSAGRLQRRKGHDLALRAIAAVKDLGHSIRYVIVGDGPQRTSLEDLVRALGLDAEVTFAGEVADEQLPAYYAACDIFVMPNRLDGIDFEGFGIVFLEAAASGRPAIGGASGGVGEAIADGETGLLVSGTDVDELARALATLVRDPALREKMGAGARERALRDFGWRRAAAAVERLHRQIGAA